MIHLELILWMVQARDQSSYGCPVVPVPFIQETSSDLPLQLYQKSIDHVCVGPLRDLFSSIDLFVYLDTKYHTILVITAFY